MNGDSLWPSNIEEGDTVTLLDTEFEVVETGPTRVFAKSNNARAEIFRWAFTNEVGVEIELGFQQGAFAEHVEVKNGK